MQLFDLTLATPAENLALDEALLDEAEAASCAARSAATVGIARAIRGARPQLAGGAGSQSGLLPRGKAFRVAAHQRRRGDRRRTGLADVRGGAQLRAAAGSCARSTKRIASCSKRRSPRCRHSCRTSRGRAPAIWRCGEHKFSGNSVRCKRRAFSLSRHAALRLRSAAGRPDA